MPAFRRCLAVLALIMALLAALAVAFLHAAAGWLKGGQSEGPADVIVVLAGSFERSMHAGDLYGKNVAPRVMVSVPKAERSLVKLEELGIAYPRPEVIYREILRRKGVPDERIEMVAADAISTADEAAAFAARLDSGGVRILVVTSPYHVRRAAMAFRDAFGDKSRIMVTGTPHEHFPDDWWRSQDAARNVLLETAKIILYLAGGRFSAEQGQP